MYRTDRRNSGCAIGIRRGIRYRIWEDYYSDMLSVDIETSLGKIEIGTAYIPPSIGHLHYPDFLSLFKKPHPVYFIGDVNANHIHLGTSSNNTTGHQLTMLINRGHLTHEGPNFPTFITGRSKTIPDRILHNNHTFHNTFAEPGPPTTSDHIPIVYNISANPIQIPIRERFSFRLANWEGYREQLGQCRLIGQLDSVGSMG